MYKSSSFPASPSHQLLIIPHHHKSTGEVLLAQIHACPIVACANTQQFCLKIGSRAWTFAKDLPISTLYRGRSDATCAYLWRDVLDYKEGREVLAFLMEISIDDLDKMEVRIERNVLRTLLRSWLSSLVVACLEPYKLTTHFSSLSSLPLKHPPDVQAR